MPLEICPVLKSEANAINEIIFAAYRENPLSKLMYSVPPSEAVRSASLKSTIEHWNNDPTERRMQIKDAETGETISYSLWVFFPQREGEDWKKLPKPDWPEGFRRDTATRLQVAHIEARNKFMGPKPYLFLDTLVTSPTHQRRGAATILINWGISRARTLNLPVFLTASPAGLPLYLRHGFQPVGEVPIDLSPILPSPNIPATLSNTCMVLPALSLSLAPSHEYFSVPTDPYPLRISPADPADFATLISIETAAFVNDALIGLAFPPGPIPGEADRLRTQSHLDSLAANPRNHYIKAVDPASGATVGWTKWHLFEDLSREQPPFPLAPQYNANIPLLEATIVPASKHRESYMAGKEYAYCVILVVDPDWQRRGVGRRLLENMLAIVDERGLDTWIDASPAGLGLYKKLGWEEVGRIAVDLGDYGGEKGHIETTVSLVRKAGGKKGETT